MCGWRAEEVAEKRLDGAGRQGRTAGYKRSPFASGRFQFTMPMTTAPVAARTTYSRWTGCTCRAGSSRTVHACFAPAAYAATRSVAHRHKHARYLRAGPLQRVPGAPAGEGLGGGGGNRIQGGWGLASGARALL